ncbi:MAG: ATP-binding cassette domain-containing protein, partial [Firmicutes bacterium]|nr:ATP-binding cassette domain-containing protein [Bacillota bacterium]
MSTIQATNLTFAYEGSYDNIFEDATFTLDTGWRLGFTGRNGRGKTTFLRLLMGELDAHGSIAKSVACDYFPYPVGNESGTALDVLQALCPEAQEWELLRELNLLDFNCEALYRPFGTLSGGERVKGLLAALFLREGR